MTAKAPNEKPAGATRPEAPTPPPPLAVKSWATRLKELLPNITRHAEGDMEGFFTGLEKDKQVQAEIERLEAVKTAEAKYLNRWVMVKGDTFPQDYPLYVTRVYAVIKHDGVTQNPFTVLLDGQKGRTDAEEVLFAEPVYGVSLYRVSSKSPYTVDGLVKFLESEERKGANRAKSNTKRESKQKVRLMAEQIMIRRIADKPGCGVSKRDAVDALVQAARIIEMLNLAEDTQDDPELDTEGPPIEVVKIDGVSKTTENLMKAMRSGVQPTSEGDQYVGKPLSEVLKNHVPLVCDWPEPLDKLMLEAGAERVLFDADTADNGLPYGFERITRGEA